MKTENHNYITINSPTEVLCFLNNDLDARDQVYFSKFLTKVKSLNNAYIWKAKDASSWNFAECYFKNDLMNSDVPGFLSTTGLGSFVLLNYKTDTCER
jgi:hypothetical protein